MPSAKFILPPAARKRAPHSPRPTCSRGPRAGRVASRRVPASKVINALSICFALRLGPSAIHTPAFRPYVRQPRVFHPRTTRHDVTQNLPYPTPGVYIIYYCASKAIMVRGYGLYARQSYGRRRGTSCAWRRRARMNAPDTARPLSDIGFPYPDTNFQRPFNVRSPNDADAFHVKCSCAP